MSSQPISSPPPSATSSPSSHRSIPDEDNKLPPSPVKPEFPSDPPPPPTRSPAFPNREDCWSEEATRTLIDAWGTHYLQLNRGNLRQKHWQEVADAVNALHAPTVKLRRTDVQCKNRIDTAKKKFKIEKPRVVKSKGRYVSPWPHFESLDQLIGESFSKVNSGNGHGRNLRRRISPSPESSDSPPNPPETVTRNRKNDLRLVKDLPGSPLSITWPVGRRSKRSGAGNVTERNFSVMAAAAAAMEAEEDDEYDGGDSETWGRRPTIEGRRPTIEGRKRKVPLEDDGVILGEGFMRLAEAIGKLGQIYQDVEEAKQRQIVELEKQRMQFAKDLEIQRMKVFMESQVHLEKLKRAKTANGNSDHRSYM